MYWLKKIFKWSLPKSAIDTKVLSSSSVSFASESIEEKEIPPVPTADKTVETIAKLRVDVGKIRDEAKDSLKTARDTRTLVYFGFLILLVMVVGLFFSYLQFIYTETKNINSEILKNQSNVNILNSDFQRFKDCLKRGGWNICF